MAASLVSNTLLGSSVVGTGLIGGLFYAWTVSVIPGTKRIGSPAYIETMQNINTAILNPAFLVPFTGVPIVVGAASIAQFRAGDTRRGWLLAAAAGTYLIGVFGVTGTRNVPLNESLDKFELGKASASAIEQRRSSYEGPWNRWNAIRTAANIVSFGLATAAAVVASTND